MKILAITLASILTVVILAAGFSLFTYPEYLAWILVGTVLVAGIGGFIPIMRRLGSDWPLLITSAVVSLSAVVFMFFLQDGLIMRWAIFAGVGLLLWLFFYYIWSEKRRASLYQTICLASVWLFFYSIVNLNDFFKLPPWLVLLGIFCFVAFITYPMLVTKKVRHKRSFFYAIIIGLMFSQLFWVITFWPVTVFVSSVFLLILFYAFSSISASYLQDILDCARLTQYITLTIILGALVLATANWLPTI